ncbi:MAG: hypothetical protein ACI8QC_003260 [Planctomycetota bacterium]
MSETEHQSGSDTDDAIGQPVVTELLNQLKGYGPFDHPRTKAADPFSAFSDSALTGSLDSRLEEQRDRLCSNRETFGTGDSRARC